MNCFVTGTDTGVGKTLISCALLHVFATKGLRVAGMKPVATGCDGDGINQDAQQLQNASNVQMTTDQVNPYRFKDAIAPHIAARNGGVCIDFNRILTSYNELATKADVVVVEGVGGFKVPLNASQDIADLAKQLDLPVVLVVGIRLGCINHALLTASAIELCGLKCAGWVANILDAGMPALLDNIDALQQRLPAPMLGVVPWQLRPDARAVALNLQSGWMAMH